jgi:hypothetical protein
MIRRELFVIPIVLICLLTTFRDSWAQAGLRSDENNDLQSLIVQAENGSAASQAELGSMYMDGRGVARDYQEALKWSQMAADQGNPKGMNGLGILYYHGWGVSQNYARALGLFRGAAEKGYAHAEFNVGMMYEYGEGVSRDPQEAKAWYEKAGTDGDLNALSAVGKGSIRSADKLRYGFLGIVLIASIGAFVPIAFPRLLPRIQHRRLSLFALGMSGLLYAGLSEYGLANNNMRFSPHAGAFAISKLSAAILVVALGILFLVRKQEMRKPSGRATDHTT